MTELRGEELSRYLLSIYWYVHSNDLVGGWSITSVDKPPSQLNLNKGEFEIGDFLSEEIARHIVGLHNQQVKIAERNKMLS